MISWSFDESNETIMWMKHRGKVVAKVVSYPTWYVAVNLLTKERWQAPLLASAQHKAESWFRYKE
jgi:hypothetical protein